MKILAFTDTHGNKSAIKRAVEKSISADLIICAGDLTNWGQNLAQLLLELKKSNKPVLIIHGNHELDDDLKKECNKLNLIFLHKASYQINEYVFFGYGGGGFSKEELKLENIAKKLKNTLKQNQKLITITHQPPYNTKLDLLSGNLHQGSESIAKIIKDLKPVLHICGHFHENFSKIDTLNGTKIINPGPDGKLISL